MAINLAQFSSSDPRYKGGFGQGAYDRARNAGLSDAQIRAALPSSGLKISETIGAQLGGNTSLYSYRNQAVGGGFGIDSYNRAIAAGMTPGQIRSSLAASGLRIGDKAAQALNVNPGMTYLGYSPYVQQSFKGNSGLNYPARPQLAPRGYGMDGRFSSDQGYSPTLYISGGGNDAGALNTVFGTNFSPAAVGGGYYDPDFGRVNYVPPPSDPNRPYGGYNGETLPNYTMPAFNYSIPGGSKVSGVKSAVSSRSSASGSYGMGGTAGMQIKNVNI